MNYLIDTNIISEVRKAERCDPHVATWFASIPDRSVHLSVIVLGEIRRGIDRARIKDVAQAAALEKWLTTLTQRFADRILPIDHAVAQEWGRLGARRPIPVIDGLLAATANVHSMTLVTRNVSDVADLAGNWMNPFQSG